MSEALVIGLPVRAHDRPLHDAACCRKAGQAYVSVLIRSPSDVRWHGYDAKLAWSLARDLTSDEVAERDPRRAPEED